MRVLRTLAVTSTAVLVLAVPALAERFDYEGTMTGSEVEPGPGDGNGNGAFKIVIDNATNEVCYELVWQKIDQPNAAHVHVGRPNESGRIVLDLNFAANGPKACIRADSTTVGHMTGGPESHYVDLHNGAYPEGAVRGQLKQ